jgi:hypothetical protein
MEARFNSDIIASRSSKFKLACVGTHVVMGRGLGDGSTKAATKASIKVNGWHGLES